MEQGRKLSLQEEMEKEARAIEQEIEKQPELEHFRISDKKEKELQERIRAYEQMCRQYKEQKDAEFAEELLIEGLGHGEAEWTSEGEDTSETLSKEGGLMSQNRSERRRTPRIRRIWFAFVAILILVFAMSITGMGSKSYLKQIWYRITDGEMVQVVDVADMNTKISDNMDEATVYREIGEAFKIIAVRLGLKPEEMYLESYQIDEKQGRAHLFYEYQGEIIRYSIYLNDSDSSLGQKQEDNPSGSFVVTTDKQDITVRRYEVEGYDAYRYVADFHFHGADYQIKGILPEEEVKEIIENLNYFE